VAPPAFPKDVSRVNVLGINTEGRRRWNVTFTTFECGDSFPLMTADATNLLDGGDSGVPASVTVTQAQAASVALGGSLGISFRGNQATVPWNVKAADLRAALFPLTGARGPGLADVRGGLTAADRDC
jgi:hypothetical protein